MKHHINPTMPIPILRPGKRIRGNVNEVPFGKLVIIYGDYAGREYRVGPTRVLIGRTDQCDITINDSWFPASTPALRARMDGFSCRI